MPTLPQISKRTFWDVEISDLFSDGKNDFEATEEELYEKFGNKFAKVRNISSSFSKGIAVYLNNVKADILDWRTKFIRPVLLDESIRLASKEDIIPMKFNTFLCVQNFRGMKKKIT